MPNVFSDLLIRKLQGTLVFAQGRGTYPAHWNTDSIPILEQEVARNVARDRLQLARQEDAKK